MVKMWSWVWRRHENAFRPTQDIDRNKHYFSDMPPEVLEK